VAKRKGTVRFNSDEVQGEGSYVLVSPLTVGEAKELYNSARPGKDAKDVDEQVLEISFDTIAAHVVEWDWVDYDDKPLPLPKDNPAIVDRLNVNEIKFLAECLTGNEAKKNLAGGSKST
jgi:hypothetical protein